MLRTMRPLYRAAIFASLVLALPVAVKGQAVRVIPKRMIRAADATGTLSVSVTPSQVTFNLVARGAAAGNTPVSITTSWAGATAGSVVCLYGYFGSSSTALAGNVSGVALPTSAIFGQMTTGLPTSYTAFTQTNSIGPAGASLKLFSQTLAASGSGSRTDALNLTIDLTSQPKIPSDTYTGTLVIEAQEL
ncbi:MAG: hypothetical protein ABSE99_16475 [Terracidiphilus sp.]